MVWIYDIRKKIKSLGYNLSTVFNQFVLRNYLLNQIVLPRMVFQTTEEFGFIEELVFESFTLPLEYKTYIDI